MTKTYAVIGDPIDHSLSPAIHNAAFGFLGMDYAYIAYRIPKGELASGVEALKKIQISGFNVTIPHKVDMMKFLNEVDDNCKTTGATNTVVNEKGFLKGYNTDMDGFLDPIKKRNIECKDSDVLLVGAGGAARAITKDSIVYDIVYMPVETELIEQSKKQGATIIYGWEMLLGQAMRSFEIWTGQQAPYQAMKLTLLGRF